MSEHTLTRNLVGALALAGAALLPAAAIADGPQATATASNHAGLAAQAADMNGVRMHLHHVLNCLVGPGGNGFDAAPGNPCANAGGGAIPQTADAAQKTKLETAATRVRAAIANNDVAATKMAATEVSAMLK